MYYAVKTKQKPLQLQFEVYQKKKKLNYAFYNNIFKYNLFCLQKN